MAGYPSNLAKKFSPTEQFPQHILPLLPLYNAQWWGYESLTAIVLVINVLGPSRDSPSYPDCRAFGTNSIPDRNLATHRQTV